MITQAAGHLLFRLHNQEVAGFLSSGKLFSGAPIQCP
jgi:hypothetical protein